MLHEISEHYPFPADTVLRAFSDPDFHRRKLATLQHGTAGRIVRSEAKDGSFSIRVERRLPVRVPGLKLSELVLLAEETWRRADRCGSIAVDINSVPLSMSCSAAVIDQPPGCVVRCRWMIEASVPLIGRALEKVVAAELTRSSKKEAMQTLVLFENYSER